MTPIFFILSLVGLLPILVSAHGYIGSVTIDGQSYHGNEPGGTTNPSIIRQVSTISPVKGATNPSLNCGMNSTLASNVANANPGSQIQVHWVGGATGDSNWPHNVGPIMHYMTKCSGSCASYDSTNAQWFKISEYGIQSNNDSWYQANIMEEQPANVTIPSAIESGNYLLRSELISLQNAMSEGGAEFYPGCIQLSIGGSGTDTPSSNDTCALPGCYSDTDPGILDPTVYDPPLTYTFPGPAPPAFVGNDAVVGGTQPGYDGETSSSSTSGSGGGSSGSSATPTAGSSSTPSASSVPTDTSSPSPTATVATPSSTPSTTPPNNSTSGMTCYLTSNTNQVLSKRGHSKQRVHKRRLVRRTP